MFHAADSLWRRRNNDVPTALSGITFLTMGGWRNPMCVLRSADQDQSSGSPRTFSADGSKDMRLQPLILMAALALSSAATADNKVIVGPNGKPVIVFSCGGHISECYEEAGRT